MPAVPTRFRPVLILLCLIVLGVGGAAVVRVHGTVTPPRQVTQTVDFEAVDLEVEAVEFEAVDGLPLRGWWIPGQDTHDPVLLCHDLGRDKADLIHLAIGLNRQGFPVFLFDFRGHGESQGGRSTLGIAEKRDILGAVDYLATRLGPGARQFGIYGVGMGAHAAVLAARERKALRVLVLDRLYPDPGYTLVRQVYGGWTPGVERFGFVPFAVFRVLNGAAVNAERAGDVVGTLLGRDLLLLAPEGDPELARAMQTMYESIPEQRDVDGNLVLVPGSAGEGLYGEALDRHRTQVEEFFRSRLAHAWEEPASPEKPTKTANLR